MLAISDRYPILDMKVFIKIEGLLTEFANILSNTSTTIDDATIAALKVKLGEIKLIFKKPYIVAYSEGSEDRLHSIKLIHNSFSNLRGIVNPIIKKYVLETLKERGITNSKLLDSNFLTTKIINWGHTRSGDSIISGKLIASLMSLRNVSGSVNNEALSIITKDFIKETGQEKTVIKMHHGDLTKGDTEVLRLVLKSELFQKVLAQNIRENQVELGQLEAKWSLVEAVNRGGAGLLVALGVSSIEQLVSKLIRTRASPALIDNIVSVLASNIKGTKHASTKKTVVLLNSTTKILTNINTVKVVRKGDGEGFRRDTGLRNTKGQFYSLVSLQTLINSHLQSVISANMGNGSSRNTLNYRTGRFAASAQVERMSQSRKGMITAFYSYMKNPYQTFEPGFKQGSPKTRNPKLLIAKSIREIAATKVGNRMRSVSI